MVKKKSPQFEEALDNLEALVQQMDSGELSLEDSLKAFEQGIALIRQCQHSLQSAEVKIQELIDNSEGISAVAFNDADE